MPARVHDPDLLSQVRGPAGGPERHVGLFGDRQGIHVGTHRHHRSGLLASQDRHHPGVGDAGPDIIEAERAQIVGDQRGRGHLAVAEFRVGVDLMSDLGDLRHQSFHLVVDVGMLCAGRPGDQPHDGGRDDDTHRFILRRLVSGCLRRSLLIGRLHLRDLGRKPRVPPRYT